MMARSVPIWCAISGLGDWPSLIIAAVWSGIVGVIIERTMLQCLQARYL